MDYVTVSKMPKLTSAEGFLDWKYSFEHYLKGKNGKLWRSIIKGPTRITRISDDAAKTVVDKMEDEYTDADFELVDLDNQALAAINMALSLDISQGFRRYKSAKELWKTLHEVYEGNENMKQSRRDLLRQKFNLFNYIPGETLEEQIQRFNKLHTELNSAEVTLTRSEINKKLLNSLPKAWDMQVALIQSTCNLNKITLAYLIGENQSK